MSKILNKSGIMKMTLGLIVALAFVGFSFTGVASAQNMTVEQLVQLLSGLDQATINQLLVQLGGSPTGTPAATGGCAVTTPLSEGMDSPMVKCLQQWLNSHGYTVAMSGNGSMGMETTYFGPATKAAVLNFQLATGVVASAAAPGAGSVGPLTIAKINAMTGGTPVMPPVSGGATCPNGNLLSNNCMPSAPVSGGATCPNGMLLSNNCMAAGGSTGPLTGSTGVVEDYTLMSSITNEDVGEDEEDVEVIGLTVEADGNSDLELTAVRVVFNESTNTTSDFEDYVSEVSVWLDGEEFARIDGSEFTDDNNWTKTIALDDGAIVKASETGDLTIAVSAVNNLDSSDDDPDSWTADITSLRYVDGRGDSTSEDPGTATRTFNFKSFASASDVELKITEDDDAINEFHIIEIDADTTKQDVALASFTLEAEGDSDLEIKKFGANVTIAGTADDVVDVIAGDISPAIKLVIDGEEYGTATYGGDTTTYVLEDTGTDTNLTENVLFDDVDFTIPAGTTVNVEIRADINEISATLAEGDTIAIAIGETETDHTGLFDVRDESNTKLADGDLTGAVSTDANALRSVGVRVSFVSGVAGEPADGGGTTGSDDLGTFTLKYKITAFGANIYVSSLVDATTAAVTSGKTTGVVDRAGTGTTGGVSVTLVNKTDTTLNSTGLYEIIDGQSEEFEITATAQLPTVGQAGQYRLSLGGFYWDDSSTDSAPDVVYSSNLDEFVTPYKGLN